MQYNVGIQPLYGCVDFAFITAKEIERDAMIRHLDTCEVIQDEYGPLTYYRGRIALPFSNEYYEVVIAMLSDQGNDVSAIGTMMVIHRWQPATVVMIGIAGGVAGKVELGDVVVANFVYYYERAKRWQRRDQPRPRQFFSDRLLYDRARVYGTRQWTGAVDMKRPDVSLEKASFSTVSFGAIGSGEKVVACSRAISRLLNLCPDLVAMAMEGAGVAQATAHQSSLIRFLEVRGISDYANEAKNDDWQMFAAEVAARFVIGLLRSRPIPPRLKRAGYENLMLLFSTDTLYQN